MEENSYNRVSISSAALQHNYNYIKAKVASGVKIMAMVKADAYGHGMVRAAKAFAGAGCDIYGVAELCEAIRLREAGVTGRIFVMLGFEAEEVGSFLTHDLTPVVYDVHSARVLSDMALAAGKRIEIHLKVDTGMSRLGVMVEDLADFADNLQGLQGISIAGVMSHFPESDDPLSESTERGFAAFSGACSALKNKINGVCHIANSGAVLNFPNTHCDMVRPGIALYGYHPAGEVHPGILSGEGLIPAMSFRSQVLQVKTIPEGTGVSYGLTYTTWRKTRIAVLPVGYEDGYSRSLSNKGEVLIRGQRAPIRGRICMNLCMVDVTEIGDTAPGDEVVFLGTQGEETISADELAGKMDSINYEVLCLLGNNNMRFYKE